MGSILSYLFGSSVSESTVDSLGLTAKDKRIVLSNWRVLWKDPNDLGVTLMIEYFKCYPEHQNAFKPFKDVPLDELRRNKRFQAHCVGIVSTLNEAFNALDDPELMRAYLNVSGERHAKRGQGRKEFDDLKIVIVKLMEEMFGKGKLKGETAVAWDKTIDVAFSMIFEGMGLQATPSVN